MPSASGSCCSILDRRLARRSRTYRKGSGRKPAERSSAGSPAPNRRYEHVSQKGETGDGCQNQGSQRQGHTGLIQVQAGHRRQVQFGQPVVEPRNRTQTPVSFPNIGSLFFTIRRRKLVIQCGEPGSYLLGRAFSNQRGDQYRDRETPYTDREDHQQHMATLPLVPCGMLIRPPRSAQRARPAAGCRPHAAGRGTWDESRWAETNPRLFHPGRCLSGRS
jgi:hypothetical protein